MKAMLMTKLKIATAAVLVFSLIAAGGTLLTGQMLAAQQDQSGNVAHGGPGNASAQAKGKDKPAAPKEMLQGTWLVTELMEAGKKASDAKAQSIRIEFKGEAITMTLKDEPAIKGKFTVDSAKSPATLGISFEKDGKEFTIPAIYEFKGDDLRICHQYAEDGDRPTAFEALASTVLMTLKKEKSKADLKDPGAGADKRPGEEEKEGFTAWGKEVGGLQAGLGSS